MPVEIRVTGLDDPRDARRRRRPPALLSALAPRADHPAWDVAVWLDILSFPGTPAADRAYRDIERWVFANYRPPYALARPEWSKGWAYTARGAGRTAGSSSAPRPAPSAAGTPRGPHPGPARPARRLHEPPAARAAAHAVTVATSAARNEPTAAARRRDVTPLDVRALHASPLAASRTSRAARRARQRGGPEWSAEPELIVPRRGVFAVHRRGGVTVADATTAVLLGAGEEYRVSHPVGHGDACTVLAFARDTLEEAVGARAPPRRAAAPGDAAPRRAAHLALRRGADPLAADEGALLLLADVAADARTARRPPPRRRGARTPCAPCWPPTRPPRGGWARWPPRCAARRSTSRASSGGDRGDDRAPPHAAPPGARRGADRRRERDLARLASDLGFAHHSHLSARFRGLFGATRARGARS